MSLTVTDPKLYRELSKPHDSVDAAEKAANDFHVEIRALREKFRLPDVLTIVAFNYIDVDGDEESGMISFHDGDPGLSERILAYSLGRERQRNQAEISRTLLGK